MNLVLMGYRCTGKSTTGRLLAERLGLAFVDTDRAIEQQLGRPIPAVVAEKGWPFFRAVETEVVVRHAARDGQVLALGGGAILAPENVAALKRNGFFVWLTADQETICRRMAGDEENGAARPSLTGRTSVAEIATVLAERTPLYRSLADLTIDTTASPPEEAAERIGERFTAWAGPAGDRPRRSPGRQRGRQAGPFSGRRP